MEEKIKLWERNLENASQVERVKGLRLDEGRRGRKLGWGKKERKTQESEKERLK